MQLQTCDDTQLQAVLTDAGFINPLHLSRTLQGCIYKAKDAQKESVVIKVANRYLHEHSLAIVNGQYQLQSVQENILREATILKYLQRKDTPNSIIGYKSLLKCDKNYYLILEDGGHGLFNFVTKAHSLISIGHLDIFEWHKAVKIIFKQLIESVDFMHKHNVCHFDISLENILINDVQIIVDEKKIFFESDAIQIKLIDFGLAEIFEENGSFKCNKYCGKQSYFSPEIEANSDWFDGQKNDIWCCGVVLFAMICGCFPWQRPNEKDVNFEYAMKGENGMKKLLKAYERMNYVNDDLVHLFGHFFQFEDERITMQQIKDCQWLN